MIIRYVIDESLFSSEKDEDFGRSLERFQVIKEAIRQGMPDVELLLSRALIERLLARSLPS